MPLRDILQKKDALAAPPASSSPIPEIKFIRSDTTTHEIISPPSYADDHDSNHDSRPSSSSSRSARRSLNPFSSAHRSRSPSEPSSPRRDRRFSNLLHRSSRDLASANIPADLPSIAPADAQDHEAQWEKRATVLVQRNPTLASSRPSSGRSRSSSINDPAKDVDIQEAIRLHEVGELEKSTDMFRRLADCAGPNNALSQVLYGLALRHGWGTPADPSTAVRYLSAAASNSASVEAQALQAGLKKGGSAKGELVLAIFELGNCFRYAWGVDKDPVAARQYYETAANLGDTDAMNEAAWCYLEGFGGKKDKFAAAKYYRLAEEKGCKIVGNSWIWKDKYNPK